MDHEEESYMDFNIRFLHYIGIWPKVGLVRRISGLMLTIILMYVFFFFGFGYEIYINLDNFLNITEALGIGFLCSITFVKMMIFLTREKDLLRLVAVIKHNFYMYDQRQNGDHLSVILKREKDSRSLTFVFFMLCILTASSFTVLPLVEGYFQVEGDNSTEPFVWKFPYKLSFPIDTTDTFNYWLVYIYHCYVGITHVCLIPACDNFVIALMSHSCGQLKILESSLEQLRRDAVRRVKRGFGINRSLSGDKTVVKNEDTLMTFGDDSKSEENFEDEMEIGIGDIEFLTNVNLEMQRRLRECIKHHQTILQFVDLLESVVSPMMLAQFFGSSVMFCTAAFQMTVSADKSVKMVSMGGLMSGALLQLGMYCYFADQIKEESEAVGTAAYSSEWYQASESLKRSLRIIMCRSQRPTVLTIGKFTELSLDTYAEILKGSYTYFAMLNELNH